jgi:hypothetical protein
MGVGRMPSIVWVRCRGVGRMPSSWVPCRGRGRNAVGVGAVPCLVSSSCLAMVDRCSIDISGDARAWGLLKKKERRSALLVLLLVGPGLHHCVTRFPLDVLALTERRIFLDVDQVFLIDVPFFQKVHGDQVRQC